MIILFVVPVLFLGAGVLSESDKDELSMGKVIDVVTNEDSEMLQTRSPRKLFTKVKSGAAFAAGVKLGSYLAGKGLGLGTGSLATSHTFQLFGKSFSTALSLSYADSIIPLPLHDPVDNTSVSERTTENVLHIAVIENPSRETMDRLREIAKISGERKNETAKAKPDNLKNSFNSTHHGREDNFNSFLKGHNKRIEEYNRRMFANKTRINSKF